MVLGALAGAEPSSDGEYTTPISAAAQTSYHRNSCDRCSLRKACPGLSPAAAQVVDEQALRAVTANEPLQDLHQAGQLLPDVDIPRVDSTRPALSQQAFSIIQQLHRSEQISSESYQVVETIVDKMPGSTQWRPMWERLCTSTVLKSCERPVTVSASFFGHASHIGFSFGHNLQIMCPAIADRHRVVVHVSNNGDYVLLRDDKEVSPSHVPGKIHRAGRLPKLLRPRMAAYGISEELITQEVLLWTADPTDTQTEKRDDIDLSVMVVCTKYSRRLNLLVRSIAGQQNFDLARAELIVAYVPGLDATEDILDCTRLLCPELNIVPMPFEATHMHSKGFLINQSVAKASGRRVILTDADIILPPDTFQRLETEFQDNHFVAVAGRKMLDPKTTAGLVTGIHDPVADYAYLRDKTPGETRLGEADNTPIGFFQCVLRSHFERVPYEELPHFEGADWRFSVNIRKEFGKETIMPDTIVLHQDHAGSRWYGTKRQF